MTGSAPLNSALAELAQGVGEWLPVDDERRDLIIRHEGQGNFAGARFPQRLGVPGATEPRQQRPAGAHTKSLHQARDRVALLVAHSPIAGHRRVSRGSTQHVSIFR